MDTSSRHRKWCDGTIDGMRRRASIRALPMRSLLLFLSVVVAVSFTSQAVAQAPQNVQWALLKSTIG